MKYLILIAVINVICLCIFIYYLLEYVLGYSKAVETFTADGIHIPKTIWTYWHDEKLPDIIQKCIATWRKYNPDYEIIVLNNTNLSKYLPEVQFDSYKFADSHQRKSDMIRCQVLAKYGGIWSDSSIVMRKSLDELFTHNAEFIGYYIEASTTNPDYPIIENWFFACVPGCKFVNLWKDTFLLINEFETVDDYVEYIKKTTDIQNINIPLYLTQHIAAQYVLQNLMTVEERKSKFYLQKAEDGPFKYLADHGWNIENAYQNMCSTNEDTTLFHKLRSCEREVVEKDLDKYQCIFAL